MRTEAQAAALFDARPAAQMALLDMGHAYGHAKRSSRCPFTGAEILSGEAIRRILITTRDGRTREGYTANRIFGHMTFRGGDVNEPIWSRITLPGSTWADRRDTIIAQLDDLQTITMRKTNSIDTTTSYSWDARLGKWCGARWSRMSTKQLAAVLRRTKRVSCFLAVSR